MSIGRIALYGCLCLVFMAGVGAHGGEDSMLWKDDERVVFLGDSITASQNSYCRIVVRWVQARYPDRRIQFAFSGQSGATIHHMLSHVEQTVLAHDPTFVSISCGINDLWQLYKFEREEDEITRFAAAYQKLIDIVRAKTKARIALMTTSELSNFPLHERQMEDAINRAIRDLAGKNRLLLIEINEPYRRLLEAARMRNDPIRFVPEKEQTHPNDIGHTAIACLYLTAIGFGGLGHAIVPQPVRQPKALSAEDDRPVIQQEMVLVPGGKFFFGPPGKKQELDIPDFRIDKYEVTNAMYAEFVKAKGHRAPDDWKDGKYETGTANLPVTGVTYEDAAAYAQWAGKRLPTEQEWIKAARGTDARAYPWGAAFTNECSNTWETGLWRKTKVGSFPKGASPCGALDMSGNVFEWTATPPPEYPHLVVVKGGSWFIEGKLPSDYASLSHQAVAPKTAHTADLGFRCVK